MNTVSVKNKVKDIDMAMIRIPLASLRCLLSYPKENKIICEIDIKNMKRINDSKSLDEIISESRLDYALGNYKTFSSAKDLIAELRS